MHELFEHTADLGLRAKAASLAGAFQDIAACLLAALVEDPGTVRPDVEERIAIEGADREYLLFDWLNALLRRFEEDRMLFSQFAVSVRENGLDAVLRGEAYDPERHALSHEVKAITYHELKLVPDGDGWLAEAIVDI
jgi:SHS2 domain-containing protein